MNARIFSQGNYNRIISVVLLVALLATTVAPAVQAQGGEGEGLVYSTFVDTGDVHDIVVDKYGSAYITGIENGDAFVAKLSAAGDSLIYKTFFGGERGDRGRAIALDESGSVYVTGQTVSLDFPTTADAYDTSCGTDGACDYDGTYYYYDSFIVKLGVDGTFLYGTYLGGSDNDFGYGIAVDDDGYFSVTGHTESTDFPTTPGAHRESLGSPSDGFVARFFPSGNNLSFSTYLGGGLSNAISLGKRGEVYVAGQTSLASFPTTTGAYDESYNGGGDAFVTKLNTDGTLLLSSFLGGNNHERAFDITLDKNEAIYLVGDVHEHEFGTFPVTPGAYDKTHNGGYDAFSLN